MATFRCNPTIVFVLDDPGVRAARQRPAPSAATAEVAVIQKDSDRSRHAEARFRRAAADDARVAAADAFDSYEVASRTRFEIPVFDQEGITTTSVPCPKEVRPRPGRISGASSHQG